MTEINCERCNGSKSLCDGCGKPVGVCSCCVQPALMACFMCGGSGEQTDPEELETAQLLEHILWLRGRLDYLFEVNAAALAEIQQSGVLLTVERSTHQVAATNAQSVTKTLCDMVHKQRIAFQQLLDSKRPE